MSRSVLVCGDMWPTPVDHTRVLCLVDTARSQGPVRSAMDWLRVSCATHRPPPTNPRFTRAWKSWLSLQHPWDPYTSQIQGRLGLPGTENWQLTERSPTPTWGPSAPRGPARGSCVLRWRESQKKGEVGSEVATGCVRGAIHGGKLPGKGWLSGVGKRWVILCVSLILILDKKMRSVRVEQSATLVSQNVQAFLSGARGLKNVIP